jgi:5-methylcytosine-specific restriction endonuclease McrA
VPRALGGTDALANLRLAHRSCNSRRGAGRTAAQPLLTPLPIQNLGRQRIVRALRNQFGNVRADFPLF